MTLESQVCSLDLAKRLKELGVKQESCFDWVEIDDDYWILMGRKQKKFKEMADSLKDTCISAFTVAELLKEIPIEDCTIGGENGRYWVHYNTYEVDDEHNGIVEFEEENLSNALAKLLIYLKDNEK
jgi:hypothetical protein